MLEKPLIVVGSGRSGTTIISEIIFAHEDLAWPSNYLERLSDVVAIELVRRLFDNDWWRIIGEKGQLNRKGLLNALLPRPAEAYAFWNRLTREDIDFSRGFLLGDEATPEEAHRIRSAVSRIVALQGRQRFAMKITGPGRIGYLRSILPDAIFINVLRDPCATVNSFLRVPFWKDRGLRRLWWTGAYSEEELDYFATIRNDPTAVTAFQVAKVVTTTLTEARRLNVPMMMVRYENFVSAPERTVADMLEFANLPSSDWVKRKLSSTRIFDQNRNQGLSPNQQKVVEKIFKRFAGA